MLLGVLAGVALVLAAHEVLGGAAVMAGVAIKASAGLAIPFVVLAARRRWRALAGVMLGTAAVVALAVLAFPSHAVGMIDVLRREQHLVALDSVPNELAHLLGMRHVSPGLRLGLQIVFGVVVVVALVRAWRREHVLTACGWAFVALVATSSWFLAWYTIWPLPFAALSRDRRLLAATLLLQVWYVGNHVPPI
jgi:alpha-1,6-mannosyltransferase